MSRNDSYYGTRLFDLLEGDPPVRRIKVSQHKVVDPSFEEQIVLPDAEYFYLSSVTVNPVFYTRTKNEQGGITIRILGV